MWLSLSFSFLNDFVFPFLISWRFWISVRGVQKINQKNTWELNLIDHLTEIIKVEEEDDAETNFQKVRYCTLYVDYTTDNSSFSNRQFLRQIVLKRILFGCNL